MRTARPFFILLQCIAFTILHCSPALAAVNIDTTLSDDSIAVGESIRMQIKVEGVSREAKVHFPKDRNFSLSLLGQPSYSSSTIIQNGNVQKWEGLVYQVSIVAYKVGDFIVPAVEIHYKNKVYKTKPFSIKVFSIPTSAESKMDIEVQVRSKDMYLGENNSATLSWFVAVDVGEYVLEFPLLDVDEFDSTLASDDSNKKRVQLVVNRFKLPFAMEEVSRKGRGWTRFQTQFLFKATKMGTFHINPARAQAKLVIGYTTGLDFFGRQVRKPKLIPEVTLGKPFTIRVLPLPSPQPTGFSGAVGNFQISASLEETNVKLGDPLPLKISIQGSSNLEKVEPKHILMPDKIHPFFELTQDMEAGKFENNAIHFKQVIRPLEIGKLTIPPFSFSYFNPKSKSYEMAKSLPIHIQVAQVERLRAEDILPKTKQTTGFKGSQQTSLINSDFVGEDTFAERQTPFNWLLLLLLSPALLLSNFFWKKHQQKQPALLLKKAATQQRKKLLQEAQNLISLTKTEDFLAKAEQIIEEGFLKSLEVSKNLRKENLATSLGMAGLATTEAELLAQLTLTLQSLRYSRAEVSLEVKKGISADIAELLTDADLLHVA